MTVNSNTVRVTPYFVPMFASDSLHFVFLIAAGMFGRPRRQEAAYRQDRLGRDSTFSNKRRGNHNTEQLIKDSDCSLEGLLIRCKLRHTFQMQGALSPAVHFHTLTNKHQVAGLWIFFNELVGRSKKLVSIPNFSSSYISFNIATGHPTFRLRTCTYTLGTCLNLYWFQGHIATRGAE